MLIFNRFLKRLQTFLHKYYYIRSIAVSW